MPIVVVVAVDSGLSKVVGVKNVPFVADIFEGVIFSVTELPDDLFKAGFVVITFVDVAADVDAVAFTEVSLIDRPSEDKTLCHLFGRWVLFLSPFRWIVVSSRVTCISGSAFLFSSITTASALAGNEFEFFNFLIW